MNLTADMTLSFTWVTQAAIRGYFKITNDPLVGSGPFTGSVHNQSILFTSRADDGSNDTIKFIGSIHTISPLADPDPSKNNYESQEENDSRKRVNRPKKEVVDSKGVAMRGK